MQSGKGVLGAESSISNNNPPKQVIDDGEHQAVQRPPIGVGDAHDLADGQRSLRTFVATNLAGERNLREPHTIHPLAGRGAALAAIRKEPHSQPNRSRPRA